MAKSEKDPVSEYTHVIKTLRKMGYKTTKPRAATSNGPDLFAIKDNFVLSVEVKRATPPNKKNSVLRVRKVQKNRLEDNLIAIVLPNNYVLVEPMRDHLLACNKQGIRYLNY